MMIVGLPFIFSACIDSSDVEDPNEQLNKDLEAIDNYLASSVFAQIVKDPYGIRMEIQELGTGLPAKSTADSVDVDYVGRFFSNNATFDQGNLRLPLKNLIDGWKIAFTTLPAGSKAKIYVPSPLAYGNVARTGIPANSILVFEVEFNEAVTTKAELTKLGSDTVAIDNYLSSKTINAIKDTTGIRYVITTPGTGSVATWYDKLTAKFTYKSISNDAQTLITVDQVPSDFFYSRAVDYPHGLKVGLQKLAKGGKATFYIPSGLGFGTTGAYSNGVKVIPENTNLIVEVELTNITQ